jgi:hypothetical protein
MPKDESTKPYHGYVSPYLKQPPRTFAEAEKDFPNHDRNAATPQSKVSQENVKRPAEKDR